MFNQHAKWLDISKNHVPWRASVASQNILLSSTVGRQDHNGFSHQDQGLIHKLAYRFKNHENLHVRGYKEKGSIINTPLELAILDQADRFTLVIDVIDRVPGLTDRAAHLKEQMKNEIIRNLAYAHEHGTDSEQCSN